MKSRGLLFAACGLIAVAAASIWINGARGRSDRADQRVCLTFGFCLTSMVIPASFDVLPTEFQAELRKKYFVEQLASTYEFKEDAKGQLYATLSGKRYELEMSVFQVIERQVENDGRNFGSLSQDFEKARPRQLDEFGPACDLSKAGRMFGLKDRALRRCIRSAYLIQAAPEFNERTQKLFKAVTVKYANGTTGPLTLKRPGLTDADRKMVLGEVAKIDAKARSLGGFR